MPYQHAAAAIVSEVTKTLEGYRFYFQEYNWKGEDNMLFRISRGKRILEERRGHKFWIVEPDQPNEAFDVKSGRISKTDLTGNGVPDVVVQEWTGGVHGDYNYYVYELGATGMRKLWGVQAGSGHLQVESNSKRLVMSRRQHRRQNIAYASSPERTTPDAASAPGAPASSRHLNAYSRNSNSACSTGLLILEDAAFAYWSDFSYSESPKPKVFLAWSNNRFRAVPQLMRKAVNESKLGKALQTPNSQESRRLFVELVYSGRADQALTIADKMGADRDGFLKSFYDQFRKSPHYYEIVALNPRRSIATMESTAK